MNVSEILVSDKIVVSTYCHGVEKEWETYSVDEAKELIIRGRERCVNGFIYKIPPWFVENDYVLLWELTQEVGRSEDDDELERSSKQFTLERSGDRPLKFRGECVASVDGQHMTGKEQNRWHELAVYRTDGGNWIAAINYFTCWQGELNHSVAQWIQTAPADPPLPAEQAGEVIARFFRDYEPRAVVQGFPVGEAYAEKQARLMEDVGRRYEALLAKLLAGFTEQVL